MNEEELKEELVSDLTTELSVTEGDKFNEALLRSKVKNAYREVKLARKYPKSYSQNRIDEDMEQFYSNIRGVALFDYNQSGAEGLNSYSADGETFSYVDRVKCFSGVVPIARVV